MGSVLAGRDADRACGLFAQFRERRELGFDVLEVRTDRPQEALARFGRRHAAGRARQEPYAEPCLELPNGMAQGRLGDAELRRGPGEAALPGDGEEGEKI